MMYVDFENGIVFIGDSISVSRWLHYLHHPPTAQQKTKADEIEEIIEPVVLAAVSTVGFFLLIFFLFLIFVASVIDALVHTKMRVRVENIMNFHAAD
jgi:hypothetical protein